MSAPTTSTPPRILHCITHLALGGAERVALNLARGLQPCFRSAVFSVQSAGSNPMGDAMRAELAEAGIPVFPGTRLPLRRGGLCPAAVAAAAAVRKWRPNIIHVHTEIPEAAVAAMLLLPASAQGAALVRTVHNAVYWDYWPKMGCWCDRRLRRTHVAGVSRSAVAAFERLRHRSGAGSPPSLPRVIYNAVTAPPLGSPLPPRDSRRLRLLFAGRFELQKGADLLPAIAARTPPPEGVTFELTLHGAGPLDKSLRAFAAAPPAGWVVHVRDPIPNLSASLPAYDLVLMPSRFEGLSLLALEAMLLGVPLVATDGPGLSEQLPPQHPWQARAGDADDFARVLHAALASRETWGPIAARARSFVESTFDPRAMFAGYDSLYRQALLPP